VSAAETIIADRPPSDGREWEPQCARCGSSVGFDDCEHCDEFGMDGHDCGEDSCCCAFPEDNITCTVCGGSGGWYSCISTAAHCDAHPRPGREQTQRGAIEWYAFDAAPAGGGA
jgi:hypothetical protein